MTDKQIQSTKQEIFRNMVLGILLYSVVLGFFNDYTNILSTSSYSTTFAVAIVMQLLTYATFALKDSVMVFHKSRKSNKSILALSVWLIMYLSKFVFLAVIDFVFGDNVEISGFLGLLLIIACLTLVQKLVELIYNKLAD